ncbi:FAD-dependent oxidoreductase [Moraxella nasovis]|uniref:FAD-dependent oxidoreductase n=1 Tax=Moraxella nasovis TaxID=2904121 RepID=UPI001F5FF9E2|nr:FAD-dependent oxidoreductase [Moraxella nasovis]UNU73235.1 FAD-dependent oxidoreductase [Moraxella nasovis]
MTIKTKNLIIGFGKAGKTLAALFDKHGEETIVVEKSPKMYGGTCINIGCIPSKKLIYAGYRSGFSDAMKEKNILIDKLRQANYQKLDELSYVQVITASASFIDDNTVKLSNGDTITAERIFINTGATPSTLPIEGIDSKHVHDSTSLLYLSDKREHAPDHLVIIGGGFIALEFAFMYRQFGSKVTIIENAPNILMNNDDDVRDVMLELLQEQGIKLLLSTDLQRFIEHEEYTEVITNNGTFNADAVLLAVGRRPNTKDLQLENTSVTLTDRGYISCDDTLKASDHIWALGDVAGSPQFTYISLDDYRIVANHLFGDGTRSTADRSIFPTSVFVTPPLSHIGMSEKQAKESGKNYLVASLPASSIVKAKILKQEKGILKAVIDADTREILGVTLFCAQSHEIINLFKLAMDHGIKADYFKNQIFTHPTISEALNQLFEQF